MCLYLIKYDGKLVIIIALFHHQGPSFVNIISWEVSAMCSINSKVLSFWCHVNYTSWYLNIRLCSSKLKGFLLGCFIFCDGIGLFFHEKFILLLFHSIFKYKLYLEFFVLYKEWKILNFQSVNVVVGFQKTCWQLCNF